MSLRVLFFMLCLTFSISVYGQKTTIDSLKNALNTLEMNDKETMAVWSEISFIYRGINNDSAVHFNNKVLNLAKSKDYKDELIGARCYQVQMYVITQDFEKAERLINPLIEDLEAIKDTAKLVFLNFQKGSILKHSGKLDSALSHYKSMLPMLELFPFNKSALYSLIATIHTDKQEIPEAVKWHFKALDAAQETGRIVDIATSNGNIGILYFTQQKYDKALTYMIKSKEISLDIDDLYGVLWAGNNVAELYMKLGDFEKGLQEYEMLLEFAEKYQNIEEIFNTKISIAFSYLEYNLNDSTFLIAEKLIKEAEAMNLDMEVIDESNYYFTKGMVYDYKKLHKEALNYFLKCDKLNYPSMTIGKSVIAEKLAIQYAKIGDFKNAYNYHTLFKELNDSLVNNINLTALELQEAEYEFEKEKTIQQQQLEETQASLRLRTIIIVAALLILGLVTIIAIILRRANQHKAQQNERLEEEVTERTAALLAANQKLADAKTRQALETAKSRFFANISHEFRTPLTLIQVPLNTALNSNTLDNKNFTRVQRALQSSNQLNNLITQVLDLTKLDAKKLTLNESVVPLYIAIRQTVSMFESLAQQRGIQLTLEYKIPQTLQIEVDKEKLLRILNNYLSNALKYTGENGKILVSVSEVENNIRLSVSDTGVGIPSNLLDKVFERYYQISDEVDLPSGHVNQYSGGTGIGLSLCKEYANLFGGRVWAESENQKGSTFFLEFPKKEVFAALNTTDFSIIEKTSKQSSSQAIESKEKVINTQKSETILIVEDNIDLRELLKEILETDYEIIQKENGKVALDWLITCEQQPDLIISDVMMPLMNGFELLKNLKATDDYRHIPVIMLTARANYKDKLDALRIGVDDYMLKPFNEKELKIRIKNLIKNAKNRQQIIASELADSKISTKVSKADHLWLKSLEDVINQNIDDLNLNANFVIDNLFISRSQLFKKTKQLTGLTFNNYLKEVRMQKAKTLLENKEVTSVKALAYSVGFKHTNYFSKLYLERFGKLPSDYL